MPTCSGKCVSGDLGTGGSRGSHGELRPAETLVTASQGSAKVMILMMMSQPGLFTEITTSFDPFKVSISSRSDDPIKPRETNIKFRSPQILHFISSRCFVGRAQLLAVQKIFITPQNAKPCAETETAHFDTSPSLQSTFTFTRFQ